MTYAGIAIIDADSMDAAADILDDIDADALRKVNQATEAAKASPPPSLELAETDVWSDGSSTWRS